MELVKNLSQAKIIKSVVVVILGSIALTISAKIKIPFNPVPKTMQTLVVLFLGIVLGPKIGLLTISLYLLEGIFGLPVFAGTPEKGMGLVYFTGPTMGYLIGFLIAAYFAGTFKYNKGLLNTFLKLIFSVSFIYILGIIWLGTLIGWDLSLIHI